jgi:hypothetical protein
MRHLAVAITAFVAAASAALAQPTISFEKNLVTVKGVTAGGRVACYGVAHDFQGVHPELLRWAREVADDDRDASVVFEIPRDVPHDSQWFAVDLATGQLAAASPRGDAAREVPFDGPGVIDSPASVRGALRVHRSDADFFVARAGHGAGSWVLLAGDGAGGDADGAPDGFVSGELAAFQPVGHAPAAPAALALADLAIVIDPYTLQYSIYNRQDR